MGQFESGNEIEDDLSRIFLEGGGGGQQTESYELALYFLARKTKTDCFEQRTHRFLRIASRHDHHIVHTGQSRQQGRPSLFR